ncbi:D-cysteine desulfhydrase [Aestuariicoccus sp. MJ-SS9]|uniref:D-cysteine desulfhydrase n=1 Tax=Aestuariicoccus sp. MJ-SS9 TaxID=3079855 RepID=UPI00290C5073|nr:D-cysteine desulfhydrase [Aestuariicoccus sp. MJ-SS9]MDU8909744.1 D-cysteine desulfhydrase [Aestuariicoccus sp. MJ-SS9]
MADTDTLPRDAVRIDFERFARTDLCHRPTPIEAMPRLTEHLGGPRLFIKRDDCTGLAMGGNKTRKLEFLVGEAMQQNADMLVTQGAVQSNHVRQTAAAACKVGMKCHVLLERRVPDRAASYEQTGNVLLDNLFGATHDFRPPGLDMNAEAQAVTEQLRAEGHRPYFIPGGGSNATGALGYANCAQEIADHASETGQTFDWLVMGTGSTGTQAGLVAGFEAIGHALPVMGVSVRQPRERQMNAVHALTLKTLEKLGADPIPLSKILVDDGYVGEGYGIPAESTMEAIRLSARQEGILLDPVYSAKGMAGLIGMVRQGFFKPTDNVLFLHTGGSTALFAYEDQINQSLN